jgi:hypothetical protein
MITARNYASQARRESPRGFAYLEFFGIELTIEIIGFMI